MTKRLLDIISLSELQRLQDSFAEISGMGSVITDINGEPITAPSNFAPFCQLMRSKSSTMHGCVESDRQVGHTAYCAGQVAYNKCANLNLVNAAAPIVLNGVHLANWLFGAIKPSNVPESEIESFALASGHDPEEIKAAYNALPKISKKYYERTVKLLALFAENLSTLCYKNYKLIQLDKSKDLAMLSLETLLDNVDVTIQIIDPHTYELVYINACLCRIMGKERSDLLKEPCYKGTRGQDSPCPDCSHKYLLDKDGNPILDATRQWEINRGGHSYMLNDRMIRWHDGRILHLQSAIDITERKALAMAEAANQAKRDFLSHMSHELRTPMNGVLGLTHLALRSDDPTKQRRYLEKIQSSASLLLGIINDVLDFSKIEAGKLELAEEVFSLRDLVRGAKNMILPKAREKDLRLRLEISPKIPDALVGDPLRISQILLNLLGNAVKFTSKGEVAVSFHHEMREGPGPGEKNVVLHCAVSDTGTGIAKDRLGLLFTPFTQADSLVARNYGGTGLGLAICKHMIENMGGELKVESEPDKGSVFSFHIVLKEAAANLESKRASDADITKSTVSAEEYEDAAVLRGMRVLLVEDNIINQEIALEFLKNFGAAAVDVADDGREAMNFWQSADYNLILMDIQMPGMDGYAATEAIRKSNKPNASSIPIIAMTANAMAEDREKSIEAGMDEHISKPIEPEKMKEILLRFNGFSNRL